MITTRGVFLISIIYTALGIIGFVPNDTFNAIHHDAVGAHYLLGFLATNEVHNVVHLAIGLSGLWAARPLLMARWWGRVTGVVLLALFVIGVAQAALQGFPPDQLLLGLVPLNSPMHVLHLVTGGLALYLGILPAASPASMESRPKTL